LREFITFTPLKEMERKKFDAVIVGSGAAGLYAALCLEPGLSCAVLNKAGPEESNSMYAQGGIASVILKGDSWQQHLEDTLAAGAGLCDHKAVEVLVKEGPENIEKLISFGVQFDHDKENHIVVSMEGAHTRKRILHCGGDATGFHMTRTLSEAARGRENITFFDETALVDVVTAADGSVCGVVAKGRDEREFFLSAPYVVIASGGIGRLFRNSTNSKIATGDGIAAAARAGAALSNMEFVQFHPTALIHPDGNMRYFLISEALRGEGAVLRNRRWEPFMKGVHPMADLAPRDVVARGIVREMKKYDIPYVYLDITDRPREFLKERFPVIYRECMKRGIDIAVNWIPVFPVQHYFMGGIQTDLNGKTNVPGLLSCGESACTGVHGANRLASNSLLECLVFGKRCAETVSAGPRTAGKAPKIPPIRKSPAGDFDFDTCRFQIRDIMTKKGGIVRCAPELLDAIQTIGDYAKKLRQTELATMHQAETYNMAAVSLEVLKSALAREKSVGAHYRSDEKV